MEEGKKLNSKKHKIEREMTMLDKKLKKSEGKKVEDLQNKNKDYEKKLNEIKNYLEVIEETDPVEIEAMGFSDNNWKENLYLNDKCIKKLEKQISEATDTVDFRDKSEALKEILEEIRIKSLLKLKNYLIGKTNEQITRILGSKEIEISQISKCLIL